MQHNIAVSNTYIGSGAKYPGVSFDSFIYLGKQQPLSVPQFLNYKTGKLAVIYFIGLLEGNICKEDKWCLIHKCSLKVRQYYYPKLFDVLLTLRIQKYDQSSKKPDKRLAYTGAY